MIDKLVGLWNTKRWLFFLLLPITLGAFFIKIYLAYNMSKAEKELKATQDIEDLLKAEQDKANQEAESHKGEADKASERRENRAKDNGLDLDWNKRDN